MKRFTIIIEIGGKPVVDMHILAVSKEDALLCANNQIAVIVDGGRAMTPEPVVIETKQIKV